MKKQTKRFLAMLLSLTMILNLGVVTAFAEGTEEEGTWMPVIQEDFTDLSEWGTTGYSMLGNVAANSYLSLADNAYKANGVFGSVLTDNVDVSKTYTVEFRAKINNWTYGPGSKPKDCNSLAVQVFPNSSNRLMFTIEEAGVKISTASGAWGNELAYPEGFDATVWHTWKLVVNTDGSVDVYADDVKLGSGALQSSGHSDTGKVKIYAKGHADSGKHADAYVDYIKLYDADDKAVYEDNFNTVDTAVWSVPNAAGSIGTVYVDNYYLHLHQQTTSSKSQTQIAQTGLDLSNYDKFKVEFDAKVNTASTGPSKYSTNGADCSTIGVKLVFNGKRLMFGIENGYLAYTANGGTWNGKYTTTEDTDVFDWHKYTIIVDSVSGAAEIYMDGTKVADGAMTANNDSTRVEIWCCAYGASPTTDSYMDNFSISYYSEKGLPLWDADAEMTIVNNGEGFVASWPAAADATSYSVIVGDKEPVTVTEPTYTVTGLTNADGYVSIKVTAVNEVGNSAISLSGKGKALWNPGSDSMDIYQIVAGKGNGGNTQYTNYRIPGIIVTSEDTVICYWEARMTGSDWADMNIIAIRSEDGGNTWGEEIIIAEGATIGKTMNNPVMVEDAEGRLHMLYCVEYGTCSDCGGAVGDADGPAANCTHGNGVFHVYSDDDGKNWSEPVNIAAQTFSDEIQHNVIATGPGHAICTSDGTLIASVWLVQQADNGLTSHHPGNVATLYSKDNGATWKLGELVPNDAEGENDVAVADPNETMLAETSDGRIMLNIRSGGGGYRALAWSETGYSDWSEMEYDYNLIDPTCMGSLLAYNHGEDPYTMLLVNCENKPYFERRNLVVKGSVDDGKTWSIRKVIDAGDAGYSDIAVDSKGTIYVLYEVNAGRTCNLARLNYECLIADSKLPVWGSDDQLTVTSTADGFTVTWPEATRATSYDVVIGENEAVNVTDTSYTVTGMTAADGEVSITVTAVNDAGESESSLTGTGKAKWTADSNLMDIYEIVAGKNNGGDTQYTNYRIPGIVVTSKDTVICYWEARMTASDWADMNIIAIRSEDGGETWGEEIIIAEGAINKKTMNNPVMVEDAEGRLHMLYCVEYGTCSTCGGAVGDADGPAANCEHGCGVFHVYSDDDGKTWSDPVNIAAQTFSDEIQHNVIATGPGHAICTSDGTLIASVWLVQQADNQSLTSHHPGNVATLYSKDNGKTWKLGELVPNDAEGENDVAVADPNETMLAETSDGRIMLNIRSGGGGYRALAWSETGYSDWTEMEYDYDVIDPTCMGSLLAYDIEGDPYTMLLVNCESRSGRNNLVVKGSTDDGENWTIRKVIDAGAAGYSDIAVDSKGTIYVLYEVSAGLTCNLARLNYACLIEDSAAVLASLTVEGASEELEFNAATSSYTINAVQGDVVTITAKALMEGATVTINGEAINTLEYEVKVGDEPIVVKVTNGEKSNTYTISFAPAAPAGTMVMYLNGESLDDQTDYMNNAVNASVAEPNTYSEVTLDTADYKFGTGSFKFNGSNNRLNVAPTNGIDVATENFSVSIWFKTTKTTDQQIIFWYGDYSGGLPQFWCRTRNADLQCNFGSDKTETTLTASNILTANEWHHVVIVREGVHHYMYLDNELVASLDHTSVRNINGEDAFALGYAKNVSSPRPFSGNMDELKIFNYALSAEQVAALYTGNELPTVNVTGVTLDQKTAEMMTGEKLQLTATTAPVDATNKDVTWNSSNESIATVNISGVVTAVKAGTVTITATTVDGEFTAKCKITVLDKSVVEAEAAAAAAEAAQAAAEAAKDAAEAAQAAADEAAASAAADKTAADAAAQAAADAQKKAEDAQAAAETAQAAAEAAAEAAKNSDAAAAAQAAAAAEAAKATAQDKADAAASAAAAAEACAKAQEAQAAAEVAQKEAEEAAAKAEAEKKAAEEAAVKAEAEKKAAEEAAAKAEAEKKAAEEAAAEAEAAAKKEAAAAELAVAKYQAMSNLNDYAEVLNMDADELQTVEVLDVLKEYRDLIADAADAAEVAELEKEAEEALAAAAVCPSEDYTDVDQNAWYHEAVDYVIAEGLMNGTGENVFDPNGKMTRAQLVTVLYRNAGSPSVEGMENIFTDVASGTWYTDAVIWAANAKVVNGVTATTFDPNAAITREQMVVMLYRYAKANVYTVSAAAKATLAAFADADQISAYAGDAMLWAVDNQIINGTGNGIEPQGTATRAQLAAVLMRWLEK